MELAKAQIRAVFDRGKEESNIGCFGDEIGACPLCASPVKRKRSFYGCEGYKEKGCKFSIPTYLCGKAINIDLAQELLTKKKTGILEGFHSKKADRDFSAALRGKAAVCPSFFLSQMRKTADQRENRLRLFRIQGGLRLPDSLSE